VIKVLGLGSDGLNGIHIDLGQRKFARQVRTQLIEA
jgi:hypothetical protein